MTPTPPPMMPELLSCPFCGHDKPRIDGPDDDRPEAPAIIVCPECGCSSDYEDTVSEARDAWNKRTPATPPDLSRELTAESVQALVANWEKVANAQRQLATMERDTGLRASLIAASNAWMSCANDLKKHMEKNK